MDQVTSPYYLTPEGLQRIRNEFERLSKFKKAKTSGEVPSTWESEEVNPEYLAFQEDMNLLEARLADYENIIKNAELLKPPPESKRHEIWLGATVTLIEDGTKQINEYMLLGTLEANPMEGKISSDSPVGRQLLGKKIGDEVVISSPIRVVYRVKEVRYSTK